MVTGKNYEHKSLRNAALSRVRSTLEHVRGPVST